MKYIKKNLIIFLCFIGINIPSFCANQDVLFIVDLSKSMNQQGLFEKVKVSLKDYIQQSEIGDRVIILGFGEDVTILADEDITSIEDLTAILKKIDTFKANEDWTYMTKALDLAARSIKDLQEAYPRRSKLIYLLTDGKNDPPPILKEPVISFEDIISKHFETYSKEGTYTYIVTYGITPEEGLKKLANKINVSISEKPPSPEKPLPAQIILSPKYLFEEVELRDYIEIPVEITIDRLYLAKGVEIFFKLEALDLPDEEEIGIAGLEKFVCDYKGQKINFTIWIKGLKKEGTYKIKLVPKVTDPSIMIIPPEIITTLKTIYKEKQLVTISPPLIMIKKKIGKERYLTEKFILYFSNRTSIEPLILLFSIKAKDIAGQIELLPNKIELPLGESDKDFVLKCENFQRGLYKFQLYASCPEEEILVEPSEIEINVKLYTSADITKRTLVWLVPLILVLIVSLFLLYCKFFIPIFEGLYLFSGGLEFNLEDYRRFCSKKIVLGRNINFGLEEGPFAVIRVSKANECLIKPYETEKIIVDGREVENEIPLSKGSVVMYKNIQFTFQRKEG
jgi:hypothetical protein